VGVCDLANCLVWTIWRFARLCECARDLLDCGVNLRRRRKKKKKKEETLGDLLVSGSGFVSMVWKGDLLFVLSMASYLAGSCVADRNK
jgi:hypothetical protein